MKFTLVEWAVMLSVLALLLAVIDSWPAEMFFWLVTGWAIYLVRVVPQVELNSSGLATGLLVVLCLAWGSHAFLSWLYAAVDSDGEPGRKRWKLAWTACLLTCVGITFVAGVSFVGAAHQVSRLLASDERWTQSGRVAAKRSQSKSQFKQLSLAIHDYHRRYRSFPPAGTMDSYGVPLHSWQTHLVAFTEYGEYLEPHGQIDFARPWNHSNNRAAFQVPVPLFMDPGSDPSAQFNSAGYALSHQAANARVMSLNRSTAIRDLTDGTSNTFLLGQVAGRYRPWGDPLSFRDPKEGFDASPAGFGSHFIGGGNFLFADGSVRFINYDIDPGLFESLATPDGGETVHSF